MNIFNFFKRKKKSKDPNEQDDKSEIQKSISLSVYAATNKGNVREHNEDNYFIDEYGIRTIENNEDNFTISTECPRIFAICDGMGGESYGAEASKIAVETLSEHLDPLRKCKETALNDTINKYASDANNKICDMVLEKKTRRSGSTLAMVYVSNDTVYTYNIGDSRVYYFNDGKLTQITEDQTLAMKKLKANIYTEEEAKNSTDTHKLTSFLGIDERKTGIKALTYPSFGLKKGTLLICSDGLTDMCTEEEISEILSDLSNDPSKALVDKSLKNGGVDNVTCIVIKNKENAN